MSIEMVFVLALGVPLALAIFVVSIMEHRCHQKAIKRIGQALDWLEAGEARKEKKVK